MNKITFKIEKLIIYLFKKIYFSTIFFYGQLAAVLANTRSQIVINS